MDTITHGLAGALIGFAARDRYGKAGFACALAASLVPDLDMPLRLLGSDVYLAYHRVVLNSLLVAPVLAFAVALAVRLTGRYKRFGPLFIVALGSLALHVFMDYANSYGFVPLWPLSDKWYALDLVFIVDPWITGTIVAGLVAMRYTYRRALVLALCAALLMCYYGGRAYLHGRAVESFHRQYPDAFRVGAFPSPANPFRWRMVAEESGAYWAGWYNLVDGGWGDVELYPKTPPDNYIRKARADRVARIFLRFARFPWTSLEKTGNGWAVKMRDLRFSFSGGRGGFVLLVKINPDGSVGPGVFSFR